MGNPLNQRYRRLLLSLETQSHHLLPCLTPFYARRSKTSQFMPPEWSQEQHCPWYSLANLLHRLLLHAQWISPAPMKYSTMLIIKAPWGIQYLVLLDSTIIKPPHLSVLFLLYHYSKQNQRGINFNNLANSKFWFCPKASDNCNSLNIKEILCTQDKMYRTVSTRVEKWTYYEQTARFPNSTKYIWPANTQGKH